MDAVEIFNPGGTPGLLFLCDHASNRVPPCIGSLGLPDSEMRRHIAFDIGARGVTLELARRFDAPAILSTVSRLVIDPNRGEDDPTLVMELYDGTLIPANRRLSPAEIRRRIDRFYRPYHDAIAARLDAAIAAGHDPVVVSIHSMTDRLKDRPPRPWQVAVLHAHDTRLATPLIARLRAEGDLCVGVNQPYSGALEGDCMARHCLSRGLAHALIEIRNDLISTPEGERRWAARLEGPLRDAIAALRSPH
ncbi:MAG: N-formylglutamate amidohydrolase [Paracoccaceae bacterium]|nr:MAG: N-formylglutamate amidohydrolase [Alphaproteobacteria bacterium]GIX14814.1 MAG: N-formylglutamate amidohydrolase [Paracoccaceae bacterium]